MISFVSQILGYSEGVDFSKLKGLSRPVPVIMNRPFKIDCSVDNSQVKITLYKKTSDGKKLEVKADGSKVKRNGDVFTLTLQSYSDANEFICRGMLHETAYERTFLAYIIGTGLLHMLITVDLLISDNCNNSDGGTKTMHFRFQNS